MSLQAITSIEELADTAGVPLQSLDNECRDCDLVEFSELCDPWELAASCLGLNESQIGAIKENHDKAEVRRLKTLQKWKECAMETTYKALVKAFLKCNWTRRALHVCKHLKKVQPISGATGTSHASELRPEDECTISQRQQNNGNCVTYTHRNLEYQARRITGESLRILERKFAGVQRQLIASDGVTLDKLKLCISTSLSFKPDYPTLVLKTTSIDEFFHKLKGYCNAQNPDILEDLVEALGDSETKRKLKDFNQENKRFQRTTKLKDLVGTFEGLAESIPSADTMLLKELEIKLKDDWQEKTLEDLEDLRLRLSSRAWCLRMIEKKSLIVTYLIPYSDHIQVEGLERYLRKQNVLQIIMDGKCIFNSTIINVPDTTDQYPSDTRKEITICSGSPPANLSIYLTSDDGTKGPASAELLVGPVSGKSNLLIKAEGTAKKSLSVPVEQETGALLIKTIGNIKQAWGVAINSKDQLIVVAGRQGLEEEIPVGVRERDKAGGFKGEGGMIVKKDKLHGDGDCILIFTLEGEKIRSFGSKGDRDGEFNMPRGVAVDDEDNIYVVDKLNSRIQKFSPSGKHLASVGKKGHGPLEFDWPKAISIHPRTKNVYITETYNHRVQILKPDLTFLRKIGAVDKEGKPKMGTGNGEFNAPLGVAFDKVGRVYITDAVNDRIQVFTENDKFIASFKGKGKGESQLRFPSAVCIDKHDLLYVTEIDNHRISVFKIDNIETILAHSISPPRPRAQSLPVSSEEYTPPRFLTMFGKKSDCEPFYFGGIAVDKKGVVYVTDSYKDELQMFVI